MPKFRLKRGMLNPQIHAFRLLFCVRQITPNHVTGSYTMLALLLMIVAMACYFRLMGPIFSISGYNNTLTLLCYV